MKRQPRNPQVHDLIDEPASDGRGQRFEIRAEPEDAGKRVDRLLAERLTGLSRSRLKGLIEGGRLASGGQTISTPSQRVKPGQTFVIFVPEAEPAVPEAQPLDLVIVYEDSDIVVVDKPAGLVVHPAPGNPDRTLVNALLAHCGDSLTGIGGVLRPGIVHRLDKETSGLIVAAKSDAAHKGLVEQFAARSIERSYLALVWGLPEPRVGEISGNIGRSPRNRKKMAVLRRGGKPAVTRYRLEKSFAGGLVSLVRCSLLTGRTHQIRVHMSEIGHPLLGDPLYGRSSSRRRRLDGEAEAALLALGGQALHAQLLGFVQPVTGQRLSFESPLPEKMRHLVNCLEAL